MLNQAEIDSLLGFDEGPGGRREPHRDAEDHQLRPRLLRAPADAGDRVRPAGAHHVHSLRNFTSDNVEVGIDNILSLRFGDYLNSIPLPAMLAVFKAEEWDNYGLMVVDSAMIYSIVDVLLGGRRGTAAMRIEGRPYTTIERTLVERLIHVVLADLSASFDPLCPVTFRFERLEVNPRFATISRLSNAAVLARLRIDMEDRGGRMELLLPYATLEPVRELLLQQFMGEKFGRDSIWETHLGRGAVEHRGRAGRGAGRADDAAVRRDGAAARHRIVLNTALGAPVLVRCGAVPLFEGRVGRRKNRIAVRIERDLPRPQQTEQSADAPHWQIANTPARQSPHGVDPRTRAGRAAGGDAVPRCAAGARAWRPETRPRALQELIAGFNASTRQAERHRAAARAQPTAPADRSPRRSMRR